MEKIIIKNSRWKHVLLLIGCLGFVSAGIWIVLIGKPFGWVAILFFGTGIPVSIWQIADSRPRLIIDEQGVLDRTLGVGRIDWEDIIAAYVRSISGNDFICLELKNPDYYAQKLSPVKRGMAAANRGLGFTDFNLNLSGVDANTDEVIELIMKYCELNAVANTLG
ncbi:MAG TPA: STM3941 family protein [Pyrinomonadaceae bacterium]|nr:STM3941 family protein [Pyrinomonadaceae bacterium]